MCVKLCQYISAPKPYKNRGYIPLATDVLWLLLIAMAHLGNILHSQGGGNNLFPP